MPVLMPQLKGQVVIKANQGIVESPREEETTTDEDGKKEVSKESKLSEAPVMSKKKLSKANGKSLKMSQAQDPK